MRSLLSIRDVAEKLTISEPMVRKLAQHGALKGAIKIGAIWRIPQSEVARILKEGVSLHKDPK